VSQDERSGDYVSANITGDVSGQVAVGKNIEQRQVRDVGAPVRPEELAELNRMLADIKAQVLAEAPPEQRTAAAERVDELAEAVTAKEPDLSTMEYVKRWFIKHLPQLADSVTGLIVHPIVGKLVEAAGETVANEFRHRFGGGS
jgi:hypothetical protein